MTDSRESTVKVLEDMKEATRPDRHGTSGGRFVPAQTAHITFRVAE